MLAAPDLQPRRRAGLRAPRRGAGPGPCRRPRPAGPAQPASEPANDSVTRRCAAVLRDCLDTDLLCTEHRGFFSSWLYTTTLVLGYIAPAKLLYSKGAISIFGYIATCYIAIL